MKKRILAILLSMIMILTSLPVSSYASERKAVDDTSAAVSEESQDIAPDDVNASFDRDKMLQGFLNQEIFDGSVEKYYGDAAGSNLTGPARQFYDICKAGIKKVANGSLTSTKFQMSLSQSGLTKTSWTLEELGLSTYSYSSASQAICSLLGFNFGDIVHSLLRDCPYELYWYGLSYSYSFSAWDITMAQ